MAYGACASARASRGELVDEALEVAGVDGGADRALVAVGVGILGGILVDEAHEVVGVEVPAVIAIGVARAAALAADPLGDVASRAAANGGDAALDEEGWAASVVGDG